MPALTTTAEDRTLNWLTGQGVAAGSNGPGGTAPVAPAMPLRVALVTAPGTDDAAGTEVVGGDYARQRVDFNPAASGQCSNRAVVRFDGMPAIAISGDGTTGGVRGFEIYDNNNVRWWHAALTTARGYQAGDAAEFPIGELVLAMD